MTADDEARGSRLPPMAITLNLSTEVEQRLREQAAQNGQTLEVYLDWLTMRAAAEAEELAAKLAPPIDDAEFERILDELDQLPEPPGHLPADFSRADFYSDHD
jgi:hypothetical protein